MSKQWMDKFVAAFPAPAPRPELVNRVQEQMRQLLAEQSCCRLDSRKLIGVITTLGLASLPVFLLLNYLYYLVLHGLLAFVFPPSVVQAFIVVFVLLASLIGALCYGSLPICTVFLLRELTGRQRLRGQLCHH